MNEKRFLKKYTIGYTIVQKFGDDDFFEFSYIRENVKRGIRMKETKYVHYINDALEKDKEGVVLITDPKAVKAAFEFAGFKHMDVIILLVKPAKINILRQYYEGVWETIYAQYFDKDFNSHIFVIEPHKKY